MHNLKTSTTFSAIAATRVQGSSEKRVFAVIARFLVSVSLVLGVGFASAATPKASDKAYAADESYAYTVRVFSGVQGTFEGGSECYTFPPLQSGAQVDFHQGDVKLKDNSKYYVRGWKLAGYDNDNSTLFASLPVNADMDLVVCYGILGDNVSYTVRYVDNNGNELMPTETFYGNIGDKPVLAYRYVEGYLPQAYNLTGELYSDASQNVFTFTYNAVSTTRYLTVITPTAIPAATGGTSQAGGAPAVAVEEPGAEEIIGEDGTPLAQPADIEDIRDDETPLASPNALSIGDVSNEGTVFFSPTNIVAILGCIAVVAAIIAIVIVLAYRKKQHKAATQAVRATFAPQHAQGAVMSAAQHYPTSLESMQYGGPSDTGYSAASSTSYNGQTDYQRSQRFDGRG